MDGYHPNTVFSSIDQNGRYAYGNQPQIAIWNIAQFATALIALEDDRDAAVERYTEIVNQFPDLYQAAWLAEFGGKLGLADVTQADSQLIEDLLSLMAQGGSDFTNTFAALGSDTARDQFSDRDAFDQWVTLWQARQPDPALMARSNPQVIPRTHLIEAAITAGVAGDLTPFHTMLAAVTQPFAVNPAYQRPPREEERVPATFCGT